MSVSINIPDELYKEALEIADARQVSVDEIFASAVAGHFAAWERLKNRAARGQRDSYLSVLDKAPDVEPGNFTGFSL